MSDQKKDLTNLLDYSEALRKSGQAPPAPAGSVMEEQKIDKIEDFESLDDYAKHNPAAEAAAVEPVLEAPAPAPEPAPEPLPPVPDLSFPETPQEPAMELAPAPADPLQSGFTDSAFPMSAGSEPEFVEPAFTPPPVDPVSEPPVAAAPDPVAPAPKREAPAPLPPKNAPPPMEQVKIYSEQASTARAAVPAAFPFSLRIRGQLNAHEKEKLLDLLSRESMGIREIDLEPQLEAGQILIPRISEYAGILLVQALRGARAEILLGPSDEIFSTSDTRGEDDTVSSIEEAQGNITSSESHLAEHMPVTTESQLPGGAKYQVIDAVTASTTLKSQVVEAERSTEYQEILEALQRELKYKAFRRGANAIINFSVQLTPLSLPTQYRILVMGSAVRMQSAPLPS